MKIEFRYSTILDMFELRVRSCADDTYNSVVMSVYMQDSDVIALKADIERALTAALIYRCEELTQERKDHE